MTDIMRVYPTAEELSSVCSQVRCPEENCSAVFQSSSNLNMHLIKHHKVDLNGLAKKESKCEYYCPVRLCTYNKDSKKHFTKLKYLKQHYLKVHATKNFICDKCNKRFSTLAFRNFHVRNCGKLFTCTCGSTYNSSEAILTHCKRKGKGHSTLKTDKPEKEIKLKEEKGTMSEIKMMTPARKSERFIYPKLSTDSFPIHYIAAIALSELSVPCDLSKVSDKGVQTDFMDVHNCKDIKKISHYMKLDKKRKNSQQTQTTPGRCKKIKISAETQTNSDYLKHKHKSALRTPLKKKKKSMETQTKDVTKSLPEFNYFQEKGNLKKGPATVVSNMQSKFIDTGTSAEEILDDSSSTSSADCKIAKLKQNPNCKVKESDQPTPQGKNCGADEDRTKKWIWENQSYTKTEMISSSANQRSLLTTVKNELFSMNHELSICNKELDANLNDLNTTYSKRGSQLYMDQGTENQIFDINKLCNIETQTEIDTFLTECNDDTSFTLCSTTETQTTDDFESLLYSNMCTQTCEEVDQLFNFNFVDIETQTAWPDLSDCGDLDS